MKTTQQALAEGQSVILDRAFYAKEDRDFYKALIEKHGARWILVYLSAPKNVLWRRICARRETGVSADCALEIGEDLLDAWFQTFDIPNHEGEIVIYTSPC